MTHVIMKPEEFPYAENTADIENLTSSESHLQKTTFDINKHSVILPATNHSTVQEDYFQEFFTNSSKELLTTMKNREEFPVSYGENQIRGEDKIPRFDEVMLIAAIVLGIIFLVSLIGNMLTLIQMFRIRRRRNTIHILILHLAIADLFVTFFCLLSECIWNATVQWLAGNAMCKIVKFMQVFAMYLSTYIIVIISIDRCYAIRDPLSRNNAPLRVRNMIIAAYVLSVLFSLPQAIIFSELKGPFEEEFYQCANFGFYTEEWQEKLYAGLSFILLFILPLLTMLTCYLMIFCTIAKKSKSLQAEEEQTNKMLRGPVRSQLLRKAKSKSLRMTLIIVIAFIIFWIPYWIVYVGYAFAQWRDNENIEHGAYSWIFFFGMTNSAINPMVYGAFHICKRKRFVRLSTMRVMLRVQIELTVAGGHGSAPSQNEAKQVGKSISSKAKIQQHAGNPSFERVVPPKSEARRSPTSA